MATTTNYGWTTPDDTALVKDGAAAIRTLGSSVDTTTKALNPSTTLGDIEYRSSTANTNTRLGIGTTGQVLTVAGGVPSWASASGAGLVKISTGSWDTNTAVAFDSVFSSTYDNYRIVLNWTAVQSAPNTVNIRYRTGGSNNTTSNYGSGWRNWLLNNGSQSGGGTASGSNNFIVLNLTTNGTISFDISSPFLTQDTKATWLGGVSNTGYVGFGRFSDTTSFDGIFIYVDTGTWTGEATVYGYAK